MPSIQTSILPKKNILRTCLPGGSFDRFAGSDLMRIIWVLIYGHLCPAGHQLVDVAVPHYLLDGT